MSLFDLPIQVDCTLALQQWATADPSACLQDCIAVYLVAQCACAGMACF